MTVNRKCAAAGSPSAQVWNRVVSSPGKVMLAVCLFGMTTTAIAQQSKPGLVATYQDDQETVIGVVATPDFRLQLDESIHPRISPQFSAEWNGVLKIDRAGRYRLRAAADVQLNGKPAGDFVRLPTGEHPIRIRYKRGTDEARLNLRWESEFFQEEPVPSAVLGHITAPPELAVHDSVEQGRFLFAELGCANCHAAGNWNLRSRRGPDLTQAGTRLSAGWLNEWLRAPRDYRKSAVMPECLDNDQDRADVTAFIASLGTTPQSPALADSRPEQRKVGQETFERVGCVKCHDKTNNLDAVGSKYVSVASLTNFIADPHQVDPHGRMPQLFDPGAERHLAGAVASFLFHDKKRPRPYAKPPAGDSRRGAGLFASHGCASCHAASTPSIKREDVLAGPAFGQHVGLPLRHYWDFDNAEDSIVEDQITGHREKVVGRITFSDAQAGHGSALTFNGKSFVELNHFHRPDTMTISVWVNTMQGGSILTWGRPGDGQRGSRELRMNIGQDGKNSVCYGEYNSDGGWKPVITRPDDVNLIDGKWHHLAVVRSGQSIQHYIDGKPQGKPGKSQPSGGDYTDRLLIGALGLQTRPSNYFQGLMDDLSIWEMALSPEQIARIASGTSPMAMAKPQDIDIKPFDVAAGCLAKKVNSPLPDYKLDHGDRVALQRFLESVQPDKNDSYHNAPLTQRDLLVKQFHCTACHELDDQNVQAAVKVTEEGRIVHVERPPVLTGVGDKLTSSRLREVLVDRQRNRPWLSLRMPHFGDAVTNLPNLITTTAGHSPQDSDPKPDIRLATAGLEMIGEKRGKAACIACHNYRGINRRKDGVVPAPDLAEAGRTIRRSWFERWMHDPQRLQSGTSMPQMFLNLSASDRELRVSQLWSAIVHQDQLPLPNGVLERQTEGTRIVVTDEPVIFRMATVTPVGQIDRAINVGVPGGRNFTFDAVSCRLTYAWKGPFLDAAPAWNGRGGNPVKAGSASLVAVRSGHVVRTGRSSEPETLRFLGYRLKDGMPVFRYKVDDATVEHRIDVSDAHVRQNFVVRGASDDVIYVGGSEISFTSKTGQRDGEIIRFPQADVVTFQIEMQIDGLNK